MMRRGELVAGWQEDGVDLPALLAQAPGGVDGNFIILRSSLGHSLVAYGTAPSLEPPSGWRELERSQATPGWNGLLEYYVRFPLPGLAVMTANPAWRVGQAVCSREAGTSVLYALSADPLTAGEEVYRQEFAAEAQRPRDLTICYTAHRASAAGFTYRYFDEQGYLLPGLNAMSDLHVATIEPRRPLETYVSSRN